ncbi:MAG: aminodeoxychorismate/anthranilate synthase component II [Alphaproteobacteria bacterium]|nr:aminodeoxychorismate/anthranilate synthase component II [Alphaproteobacteria bacterium]MBV9372750.1 aminodeoxychorismate/anthranilate synthase component II [Alphaproteobacteria bacterium]MBV9900901.1 aminodeoxychorismate/anthranilate synthase component II [Alphaproteobacteria bacterium]
MSGRILLIDNLDSFTFNLVEAVQRLGSQVRVVRNTMPARAALAAAREAGASILISPGPGAPVQAGCCLELIALAKGQVPVAGICLGQQAIVLEAGGEVARAPEPVHGKASLLDHDGEGPFAGIRGPVHVGRYHSLCTRNLPSRFRVHAEIDGMAMAISDPDALQVGLQFHPESILTPAGQRILANLVRLGTVR